MNRIEFKCAEHNVHLTVEDTCEPLKLHGEYIGSQDTKAKFEVDMSEMWCPVNYREADGSDAVEVNACAIRWYFVVVVGV